MKANLIFLFVTCALFSVVSLSFLMLIHPSEWALMFVAFAFSKVSVLCVVNYNLVQRIEKLEGAVANQTPVHHSI